MGTLIKLSCELPGVCVATTGGRSSRGGVNSAPDTHPLPWDGWPLYCASDKVLACSLIDKAFATLAIPPERHYAGLGPGGRSAELAFLAVQASQVGYGDMKALFIARWRTVQPRRTAIHRQKPLIQMSSRAGLLAIVDPPSARHVFASIEQYDVIVGSENGSHFPRSIDAWLLTDAGRGQELLDRALDELAAKPDENQFSSLLFTAWTSAAPPAQKAQYLVRSTVYFQPDFELWISDLE